VLVQAATAPLAITADAVSFVASALTLGRIRRAEARPDRPTRRHLVREILEGMRVVAAQPILRALTGCSVTANIFVNIYIAVSAIFAIRELGLSAAAFGALTAASGLGGLLGAAAATRVSRRLGIGPTLAVMQILAGLGTLSVSLVRGPAVLAGVELAGALVLWDCAVMVYVITSASLRQAIVPDALQGRVVASMRMITWGIPFVGFLLGGLLGERLGLRPTLVIAGLGNLLAAAWPLTRPIRTLRAAPATATVPPS
jgi:Na+/melibiose symporter-like transporter